MAGGAWDATLADGIGPGGSTSDEACRALTAAYEGHQSWFASQALHADAYQCLRHCIKTYNKRLIGECAMPSGPALQGAIRASEI